MVNRTKPTEATTMGKYFDKLIQISEELDKQIEEANIILEDGENTIEISTDSLTDDQKEEILLDKGIDKKTLDNLKKDPKKLDGALTAVAADDVKQESVGEDEDDDISEEVVIRIDDDDLDLHGYLKSDDGLSKGELEWTDDIKAAKAFQHEELGQNKIEAICSKFHYDPSTFKTISLDPRADEPYEDDEESNDNFGENWVSLDPMHPQATTLP
jgi:hypothetical protein